WVKSMPYDKLRANLKTLDDHLATLKLRPSPDSEMSKQLAIVRDFLADESTMSFEQIQDKWTPRFKEFYDAQIAVMMLSDAVTALLPTQKQQLTKYLKTILGGDITQGSTPEMARDLYYELWLAALLVDAGFKVTLKEPDIVVEGNGLSKPIGIACKYPA